MNKDHKTYGSDILVDVLKQHHIKYIAYNPGSTFRGLHDSLLNDHISHDPKLILCCHEEIAVAIAHGYAKASGDFMAVLLHSNVGLQHASMAIFNAWCDRMPILILGGIGPVDATKRRPWIDWIHTSNYNATIIRDFVKWQDQPASLEATIESIYRACRFLNTEPKAPVYIAIDTLIQENIVTCKIRLPDIKKLMPPTPPQASVKIIDDIAKKLIASNFPMIIADFTGKQKSTIKYLVKLSELLSIPVIDCGGCFNFPNKHPLCLTGAEDVLISRSDFILALDVQDLTMVLQRKAIKQTEIIHVTLADYLISQWAADYQQLCEVDQSITADTAVMLPELYLKCQLFSSNDHDKYQKRYQFLSHLHDKLQNDWLTIVKSQLNEFPMTMPAVLYEIWQVIEYEQWILANYGSVSTGTWVKRIWEFNENNRHLGFSGGAGLGYGLGASIGVALACTGNKSICINLQSDGDYLFTPSALWTIAHYKLAILIIMMNNCAYDNTRKHATEIARIRGRDVKKTGSNLNHPKVDYAKMACSFGIKSYQAITRIEDIQATVKKAVESVKQGEAVLLDMRIK